MLVDDVGIITDGSSTPTCDSTCSAPSMPARRLIRGLEALSPPQI